MARPVPRRRAEREAPDADKYTSRSRGRSAADDEDEPSEERRPRRGRERGELPTRGGGRSRAREEAPEAPELPSSKRALAKLDDNEWADLVTALDLDTDADEDEVWEAIEEAKAALEQEEEKPRRGRGRTAARDEDEDEPPARGRGRGRRAAADDDEDEKPSRGRGRGRSSRDEDDEEDDAPKRKPRGGFEGYKATKSKTYTGDFKLTPELLLVKFLEDEPFDSYAEHGLYKELNDGQRVWVCIEDGCPICNTGHKPRAIALWNIVVIPEEGEPHVEVLRAGPMLSKEIEKKASLKTGPMSKEYYALAQPEQEKNSGVIPPIVELVRERDVKDEWEVDPFTDEELEEFFEQTPDPEGYVKFPSLRQVKDIARKLIND